MPDKLCHYTGVGALQGIVDSGTIWSTQSPYLNDYKELKHASEIMSNQLYFYEISDDDNKKEFASVLNDLLSNIDIHAERVYITSFSTNENQLSQWRGYTPENKGVSITFNLNIIQRLIDSHSDYFLVPCQYNEDKAKTSIEELLHSIFIEFESKIEKDNYKILNKYLVSKLNILLLAFASIKSPDFKEEEEWRLIIIKPIQYSGKEVKFREGTSMLIPYYEVDLKCNPDEKLFTRVLAGPSQYPWLLQRAISQFNHIKKFTAGLSSSDISYRDW